MKREMINTSSKKKRIERIIAREGLVVVAFLIVAFVLMFNKCDLVMPMFLTLGYPVYLLLEVIVRVRKTIIREIAVPLILAGISLIAFKWRMIAFHVFPYTWGNTEVAMVVSSVLNFICAFYEYITFLSYPTYLLARFAIWAIKTLRRKE